MPRGRRQGTIALLATCVAGACATGAQAATVSVHEVPLYGPELVIRPTVATLLNTGQLAEPLATTLTIPTGSAPITVSDGLLLVTSGRCRPVVPLRTATCAHPSFLEAWVDGGPLADRITVRSPGAPVYVRSNGGDDVIDARGNGFVDCGAGYDTVTVGGLVEAAPDCERVTQV